MFVSFIPYLTVTNNYIGEAHHWSNGRFNATLFGVIYLQLSMAFHGSPKLLCALRKYSQFEVSAMVISVLQIGTLRPREKESH